VAHADFDPVKSRVVIHTVWNEKDLLRAVPGTRWDAVDRVWAAPAAWATLVLLRGVLGEQLTLGQRLVDWAWQLRRERVDLALERRVALTPLEAGGEVPRADARAPRLYPFQRAGVQFMDVAQSGLLGDEMGTGKTPQLLGFLAWRHVTHADGLPALVISPNSVKRHWARLAATWLPEATPYVVEGSALARRKVLKAALRDPTALVVMNIEAVRLFSRLAPYGSVRLKRCRQCDPRHGDEGLTPARCDVHHKELNDFDFKSVILDEAHRIKEPKAQQTRAIWHVGHQESVLRRWALTGTPIANDPSDLWSVMHFVAPDDFPTRSAFVDRYCLISWNAFGGTDVVGVRPDTRDELFKVLDPRFRRMLKAVVLPQLPPKVRSVRYAELTPTQLRMYRELEERLVTRTDEGELVIAPSNLAAQTRLMQLACASVSIEKPDPDDVTTWQVTLREPAPKLDVLEEVLDELGLLTVGYDGPPVLIAAEYKQLLNLAAARLRKLGLRVAEITGDIAEADRQRALDDLHARRIHALLFTNKAGGVGLDMSASDTLINVQRSWSLVDERQKEDRPHRPGAEIHECIRIIDITTRGTVEETQVTRLHEKLLRLDEITRDRAALVAANVHADTAQLDAEEQRVLGSFVGLPPTEEML
jgi:SNF2 family DNA or RNA helicase